MSADDAYSLPYNMFYNVETSLSKTCNVPVLGTSISLFAEHYIDNQYFKDIGSGIIAFNVKTEQKSQCTSI